MKHRLGLVTLILLCGALVLGFSAGLGAPAAVAGASPQTLMFPFFAAGARSDVEVLVRGGPVKGANGLYFDAQDRLHIASVVGREVVVMDTANGRVLDRIGPERGVDTPDDCTIGPDGSLYWTSLLTGEVGRLKPDGTRVIVAQDLWGANPITFSDDGRLFTALEFLGMDGLYELDPDGVAAPRAILPDIVGLNAFDFGPDGKLYGPLIFEGKLVRIDVDTAQVSVVADGFVMPVACKFDSQGRLFTLDQVQGKVLIVDTATGQKTPYATIEIGLDNLAFNSQGQLFVSNNNTGAVYQVSTGGAVRYVNRGGLQAVMGLAVLPRAGGESLYVAENSGVAEYDGASGAPRAFTHAMLGASGLKGPMSASEDGAHLVLSTWFENAVQVWDPATGTVLEEYADVAVPIDAVRFQGDIVASELGATPPRVVRLSALDPSARVTLAELGAPTGLAATTQGLWAADWAAGTVVQIARDGVVLATPEVVASGLQGPEDLVVAPDGSLLVVEALARRLSRIALPGGTVTVVADNLELGAPGPASMPPTWGMDGVAVGPSGAIYVGGSDANLVYKIR